MCFSENFELNNSADGLLIDLIKQGNETAFSQLCEKYTPLINKKCGSFSHLADFEDLYQEGIIALFYAANSYDTSLSSFFTFASVCIERALISYCRTFKNKKFVPAQKTVPFDDCSFLETLSPEQLLIEKENEQVLLKEIKETLSDFEFAVLLNYNFYNSYEEVAKKLSTSVKSVNNALQRARKKVLDIKKF